MYRAFVPEPWQERIVGQVSMGLPEQAQFIYGARIPHVRWSGQRNNGFLRFLEYF